jgi:hypothetical protein
MFYKYISTIQGVYNISYDRFSENIRFTNQIIANKIDPIEKFATHIQVCTS